LQYDDPDDRSTSQWGFQVNDAEPKYEWFKLGLDPTQERDTELAKEYPSTTALPCGDDESCERLVVDYLTALRTHAENVLMATLPHSILRSTPPEYIITVPAVWSPEAESKTRSCAARAGMGRANSLRIIPEPEAAAIYALDAMDSAGLRVGDTFVVCDAGGGYEITLSSLQRSSSS
jgi:molecular chaperone DnaK (HSP70)